MACALPCNAQRPESGSRLSTWQLSAVVQRSHQYHVGCNRAQTSLDRAPGLHGRQQGTVGGFTRSAWGALGDSAPRAASEQHPLLKALGCVALKCYLYCWLRCYCCHVFLRQHFDIASKGCTLSKCNLSSYQAAACGLLTRGLENTGARRVVSLSRVRSFLLKPSLDRSVGSCATQRVFNARVVLSAQSMSLHVSSWPVGICLLSIPFTFPARPYGSFSLESAPRSSCKISCVSLMVLLLLEPVQNPLGTNEDST